MRRVILDVDTGIDDALAIAYAVHSPELTLLGITTGYGNTSVEEATRNTLQILELLDATQIPVAKGAANPLFRTHLKEKAILIHGEDGLGNANLPSPMISPLSIHASEFIVESIRTYPNQVTVITTGGLTNLAMAIMHSPDIVQLVDRVVMMGGAVTVPGNVTPVAEANIYTDPEAAEFVFRSGIPITLVGLDVTMQTILKRSHLDVWRKNQTPLSLCYADICEYYMDGYARFNPNLGGCALHDPLAVGVVIDPTFVKTRPLHVQVDIEGSISIGRTVADLRGIPEQPPNMDVCLEVDAERFVSHFLERAV